MKSRIVFFALVLALLVPLAGCDGVNPEQELAERQQARVKAEVQRQYANFEQLLAAGRADLALNVADHVLKTYPDSEVAPKLREQIEPLRAQILAEREARRLVDLWVYHDDMDEEAGGRVRSAYLFAKDPIGPAADGKQAPRARMVLRRHPQWGDDVYLLSERGPFQCGNPCELTVQFDDDEPRVVGGEIPETGEHAIFVKDFDYFVDRLPSASRVRFDFLLQDGGTQSALFEVGGYQPETIEAQD